MKSRTTHVCRLCGTHAPRWQGRCAHCGEWNSLDALEVSARNVSATRMSALRDVNDENLATLSTGVEELDRVLGGGLVAGSTTLLFGEPGVGKSTLALMALRAVAARGDDVVLIASEESAAQVARRARRLGDVPASLAVATTTSVDGAEALIRESGRALYVVDSISAMRDDALTSAVGSLPQIRQAAERLCTAAKEQHGALLLIGHVTKDGELAGPRALEHLVDTVLRIEGDRHASLRVLRALKHRFGSTQEIGLLEMVGEGLRSVEEDSLGRHTSRLDVPGVVFTVTNDSARSFLIEVQALVAQTTGSTRRVAHQISAQRLALMLAVLEARCGVDVSALDVFAATAGGLAAVEPGVDVALALAVASVTKGFAVPSSVVAVGEVGLAGELRAVSGLAPRVREARRRGATHALVPVDGDLEKVEGIEVRRCASLVEAIAVARDFDPREVASKD